MKFHVCFLTYFMLSPFLSTWGLKSESIIGEEENQVPPANYGYYVTLIFAQLRDEFPYDVIFGTCGAAIISDKYAVTASHCLKDTEWKIIIFAAPPNIHPTDILASKQKRDYYRVVEAYVRKRADADNYDDIDIGIVRINGEFTPSNFYPWARTIELAETKTNYAGVRDAEFLGAGENTLGLHGKYQIRTNKNGRKDYMLRKSTQMIYNYDLQYTNPQYELLSRVVNCNQEEVFCGMTTSIEPNGVLAPGDSGGPLVHNGKVIGIASRGSVLSPSWGTIAHFINVAYHKNFVNNVVSGSFDPNITEVYKYRLTPAEYEYHVLQKPMTFIEDGAGYTKNTVT